MTEEFKLLDERTHIITRSAMYIGSTALEEISGIINFEYKKINYIPGLVKIIEEIYQNSVDEAIRTDFEYANEINVSIKDDLINGLYVEVIDNGRGIPVRQIDGLYQAELGWTRARSGSNFSDDNRTTIGLNGIGSFATNCFSTKFTGKSCDGKTQVIVECENNCDIINTTTKKHKVNGTSVKFYPDLNLFNTGTINYEHLQLIEDRLTNLAICYPRIKFQFNDKKIQIKNAAQLAKSFHQSALALEEENYTIVISTSGDDEEFRHISYVNGIAIKNGGAHIEYFINGICNELIPLIKRKWKIEVLPNQIKQHLLLGFWIRNLPNPKFDSQSKERITNAQGEIKAFFELDFKSLAKKIVSTDDIILPAIDSILRKKEAAEKRAATNALKKAQKKKIVNHIVANDKDPENKTIFICEGISAVSMLLNVRDPKIHGGYSLRGKVMNTHGMSDYDIIKNKELSELISILGLDCLEENHGIPNYGRISILTDFDKDGHSIFCLLLMFFARWPNLFHGNRIVRAVTPLYVAKKKGAPTKYYYHDTEYEKDKGSLKGYEVTFIKGLGSMEKEDYKETIIVNPKFYSISLDDIDKLNMAFGEDADLRKEWMMAGDSV